MEENRDYHAYRYGDYLTPGSELKIEHSVVCEIVDISTLITMGKRIAGFMAWAFGPDLMRRSACWQPEADRNASVRESISL